MRPDRVFDPLLQHERTALAWERTAIATIVNGTLLARAAADFHRVLAVAGIIEVLVGGLLLVWTGSHYEELHGPLRAGVSPVHPRAARRVGMATVLFTGVATTTAVAAWAF
jgi:uncharacterized membrane protein YidH (DUF202 family)